MPMDYFAQYKPLSSSWCELVLFDCAYTQRTIYIILSCIGCHPGFSVQTYQIVIWRVVSEWNGKPIMRFANAIFFKTLAIPISGLVFKHVRNPEHRARYEARILRYCRRPYKASCRCPEVTETVWRPMETAVFGNRFFIETQIIHGR